MTTTTTVEFLKVFQEGNEEDRKNFFGNPLIERKINTDLVKESMQAICRNFGEESFNPMYLKDYLGRINHLFSSLKYIPQTIKEMCLEIIYENCTLDLVKNTDLLKQLDDGERKALVEIAVKEKKYDVAVAARGDVKDLADNKRFFLKVFDHAIEHADDELLMKVIGSDTVNDLSSVEKLRFFKLAQEKGRSATIVVKLQSFLNIAST